MERIKLEPGWLGRTIDQARKDVSYYKVVNRHMAGEAPKVAIVALNEGRATHSDYLAYRGWNARRFVNDGDQTGMELANEWCEAAWRRSCWWSAGPPYIGPEAV